MYFYCPINTPSVKSTENLCYILFYSSTSEYDWWLFCEKQQNLKNLKNLQNSNTMIHMSVNINYRRIIFFENVLFIDKYIKKIYEYEVM